MKTPQINTKLPVKGRMPDPKPGGEPTPCNRLGMIFARPPFSELTSDHGFIAILQTPYVSLPADDLAGPGVSNYEQDDEVLDFLRFKTLKKEAEKKIHYQYKEIYCVIDWSTHMSFALESVVGSDSKPLIAICPEVLALGEFQIDDKEFILGVQNIRIFIHERPYILEVKVVKELFPGHHCVDIQMVLGREFLNAYPGLALEPILRQGSVDFVPWDPENRVNGFDVNDKGELMVYVCGVTPLDAPKLHNPQGGGYGVFFGPGSVYNMSLPTKMEGLPRQEAALMEGIIAVADLVIDGGFIFGTPTFNSIRIFTDSQLIVDLLNPGGTLREYKERGWRNKQGKKIGFWSALKYWNAVIHGGLVLGNIVWMKKDLFAFERVEKKTKGLQAARHLAQCGQKYSEIYLCMKDFGDAQASPRYNIKEWEELGFHETLYISTPHISCNTYMAKQKKIDFVNSRVQANAKFTRENAAPQGAMIKDTIETYSTFPSSINTHIASFFYPEVCYRFEEFASKLADCHKYSAMGILEILDWTFLKEVLNITEEKRGLQDTLEFFKEADGTIHFFHKSTETARERALSKQIDIDDNSSEFSGYSCSSHHAITKTKNVNGADSKEMDLGVLPSNWGGSHASVENASAKKLGIEDEDTKNSDTKDTGTRGAGANNTDICNRYSGGADANDVDSRNVDFIAGVTREGV